MILNYEEICKAILTYVPGMGDVFPGKDAQFENAVRASVAQFKSLAPTSPVHLCFSGGCDSTVMLYLLVAQGFSVIAHTICATPKHPDVLYAKLAIEKLNSDRVTHVVHEVAASDDDVHQSNQILQQHSDRADNYYILLKTLKAYTNFLVNCDCIDELTGGYYSHQRPDGNYYSHQRPDGNYGVDNNTEEDRRVKLVYHLGRLIPDHLFIFQRMSEHFGMTVYLPYGDAGVMTAAARYSVSELVDGQTRKKPMCLLARTLNVPEDVIVRKKLGLCSALDY